MAEILNGQKSDSFKENNMSSVNKISQKPVQYKSQSVKKSLANSYNKLAEYEAIIKLMQNKKK